MSIPELAETRTSKERRAHERDVKTAHGLVHAAKYLGTDAVHDIQQGVRFALSPDSVHIAMGVYNELENDDEREHFLKQLALARKIGADRFTRISGLYETFVQHIEQQVQPEEAATVEHAG